MITQEDWAGEPTQAIATLKRLDPLVTSRLPSYQLIQDNIQDALILPTAICPLQYYNCYFDSCFGFIWFVVQRSYSTRNQTRHNLLVQKKQRYQKCLACQVSNEDMLIEETWVQVLYLLYAHMKCIGLFYISPPGKHKRKERLYSGVYGVIVAWLATINDKLQCWYRLQERPR